MPNVKIRIESGTSTTTDDVLEKQQEQASLDKKKIAQYTIIGQQAVANAKKIVSYGISNIGNFTGDYTKTEGIQFATGIATDVAGIGIGFATNPIAGAIALVGVAVSRSLEAVSYFQDQKHKEIESNYLRERSGNSLTNGSRGTEN